MNINSIIRALMFKKANERPYTSKRSGYTKVKLGELVRVTAGGHHAYYNSNVGLIRKPIQ